MFLQSFKVSLAFPEKMVLYSPSKFSIKKPCTNIQSLTIQTSGRPQKKFKGNCNIRSYFYKKFVLYLSSKFRIFEPCTNIQWLREFDLRFWQTSEKVYRKLQYGEEFRAKLQGLSRIPRKMALYSMTKFYTFFSLARKFNHSEELIQAFQRL